MRYIPVSCQQREAMLRAVGVPDVGVLFEVIPEAVRFDDDLNLPDGLSELELSSHLGALAEVNVPASRLVSFMGAGCYDHYVPSVVDHVIAKPELFTAYTPYQPEVSQGTLQAIYEYQSMICALTGMDVSYASMYDAATALVEAALMACRVTRRNAVACLPTVHPEWQATLGTYAAAGRFSVAESVSVDGASGAALLVGEGDPIRQGLADVLAEGDIAAVLVQSPNFFGTFEDLEEIARVTHDAGALLVVATDPILLGIMEPPSAYGADIVVGEGQPLGSAMSYGGPGFGFFTCRQAHVRQMPGRVVGRTVDVDGAMAFVLTLSTREQHIRREKATSNICSNHALNALAAGAYLSAVGAQGLAGIARACVAKAHYLREQLLATGRFRAPWESPFGYEFALEYLGDVRSMQDELVQRGFFAGVDVSDVEAEHPTGVFPAAGENLVLFAVTEKHTRLEMDAFVQEVASL